jgi:hypothetical protein
MDIQFCGQEPATIGLIAAGYVLAGTSFVNNENPLLAPPLLLKPKVHGSQRDNVHEY